MTSQQIQKYKSDLLKTYWGYDSFRPLQSEIIDEILTGRDVIALLPTGGGKSLCYQLPAILSEGVCLVISPLLALMRDQVQQLIYKGIEAEFLSSELSAEEQQAILSKCKNGLIKLLYISPERLSNSLFLQNLEEIEVSFIAVDEAHCVSEWGQDFRPSYQNIEVFRNENKNVPMLALTATATPKVLDEISKKLGLRNVRIFQKSFRRDNISIVCLDIADKFQKILDISRNIVGSSIIYCRTRQESEDLTHYLQHHGVSHCDYYHAGLPADERRRRQDNWIRSESDILISTNAFGMGIDKENVRRIIHLSPPVSLENYYQEIGRAGRDGAESISYIFYNETELKQIDDIFQSQIPTRQEFARIVRYLYSIYHIADREISDSVFPVDIHRIQKYSKSTLGKIRNILGYLHNEEIIFYNTSKRKSAVQLKFDLAEIETLPQKDAHFLEFLQRNISGLSAFQKSYFSEYNLSNKTQISRELIRERLQTMQYKGYIEYLDGALDTVNFIKYRDDKNLEGSIWQLFQQIQSNRLKKWEEMKFYLRNRDLCKTRLILAYFGEENAQNCGKCNICMQSQPAASVAAEILQHLARQPAGLDQLAVALPFVAKSKLQENLIELLDAGKIRMLDFRTYMLS